MQDILILSRESCLTQVCDFAALPLKAREYAMGDQYIIEFENDTHIRIVNDDEIRIEFENNELDFLGESLEDIHFYLLVFTNFQFFKKVVPLLLKNREKVWCHVADDFLMAKDFVARIQGDPDWDWR